MDTVGDSFVHLHLHTQYSLLDGTIRVEDLIPKAVEFGMPAVAQTDHGNMFGAIDFYCQAKEVGIRPILGSEIYFSEGSRFDRSSLEIYHLILLCKSKTGYENLCQILSKAYLEGFHHRPRADWDLLTQYSEGLIATTACLRGQVGHNFLMGLDEQATKAADDLREVFGDDLYLEIQDNGLPGQKSTNEKIIALAKEKGLPLVATNNCHYLEREDATAREVLLCVQKGKSFTETGIETDDFYFKSAQEMWQVFRSYPEAIDNTLRIAEKCDLELKWKDERGRQIYHLPEFHITTQESKEEFFRRQTREGLEKRFNGPHFTKLCAQDNWEEVIRPRYLARLEEELDRIIEMGFEGYFLIVADFITWAKQKRILVGPGRGSGSGSLVAYAMDITNIDPLPYDLLFERFINPERITLPDFDVDFCQNRRGEVIDYVTEKYGKERVAQIITFGKMLARAVLRDVARVFDLPYPEADKLAKLVPNELGITLEKALSMEPKITELMESDPKIRQIVEISHRLEGLPRHASIHAAGVIITNLPLVKYTPLYRGKEGEQVIQFDKDFSEKIGLVKFDFLGLKTLTVIDMAMGFIRQDKDPHFDIEAIDMEDREIFQFISRGETAGVFQLESWGMVDLCQRIRPDSLEDITAINALYRPGPLESGMVDDFVEVKHGKKKMALPFPELKPILQDTYGVIIYQEQVMNIARIVAGYGLGQADMLRRAMGKKKMDEMERHREIFLKGAKEKGFDVKRARELYDLMANFGAYGFNKSHAVAYAYIAYQTAYLKRYHTAPFFAALLSSELSNANKVTLYIHDAKKYGIDLLPPDVNESLWHFNVVGNDIRFGMGAVKNVGEGAITSIIAEKKRRGPFKGFLDFCERINPKEVNKRVVESLILIGAFDKFEKRNRRTLKDNMELMLLYGQKRQQEREIGQVGLFDNQNDESEFQKMLEIDEKVDFDEQEKLLHEAELMGIYISGHPLDHYRAVIEKVASMDVAKVHLSSYEHQRKKEVVLVGMISSVKTIITKKGDKMALATLEDLSGKIDCIIFPRVYNEYQHLLETKCPLVLKGSVNFLENPYKFFPGQLQKLEDQAEQRVSEVRVDIDMTDLTQQRLERLKQVLQSYRGSVPMHLIFKGFKGSEKGWAHMPLGADFAVTPSSQMAAMIDDVFQRKSVKFIFQVRAS